jgi:hypothetical protein
MFPARAEGAALEKIKQDSAITRIASKIAARRPFGWSASKPKIYLIH